MWLLLDCCRRAKKTRTQLDVSSVIIKSFLVTSTTSHYQYYSSLTTFGDIRHGYSEGVRAPSSTKDTGAREAIKILHGAPHAPSAYSLLPWHYRHISLQHTTMTILMRPTVSAFGRQVAFFRRYVSTTTPLLFSKSPQEQGDVLFSGEQAAIYAAVFEQHAQPTGPWETMDSMLTKYAPPNSTVMDLATGPGEPGVTMAKRHSDMRFILSDVSPDMIEKAKARAEGLDNVDFSLTDMQEMKGFSNDSLDAVVCCYGLMFPPNVKQAVSEIHRVLKPGGCFITTFWKEMPLVSFTNSIMESLLGGTPPPPPINPLSLKEPGLVNALLTEAQFNVVHEEEHEYPFSLTDNPDFAFDVAVFPIMPFLEERTVSDREVARQMFDSFVKEQNYIQPNGEYVVPGNVYELMVAKKE